MVKDWQSLPSQETQHVHAGTTNWNRYWLISWRRYFPWKNVPHLQRLSSNIKARLFPVGNLRTGRHQQSLRALVEGTLEWQNAPFMSPSQTRSPCVPSRTIPAFTRRGKDVRPASSFHCWVPLWQLRVFDPFKGWLLYRTPEISPLNINSSSKCPASLIRAQ